MASSIFNTKEHSIRTQIKSLLKAERRLAQIETQTKGINFSLYLSFKEIRKEILSLAQKKNKQVPRKEKRGPKAWPKKMTLMMLIALELSKGDRVKLNRIRDFLRSGGEFERWLNRTFGFIPIHLPSLTENPDFRTLWANHLKQNLYRNLLLDEKPSKRKKLKRDFIKDMCSPSYLKRLLAS